MSLLSCEVVEGLGGESDDGIGYYVDRGGRSRRDRECDGGGGARIGRNVERLSGRAIDGGWGEHVVDPSRRQRGDGVDVLWLRGACDDLFDGLDERISALHRIGVSAADELYADELVWSSTDQVVGGGTLLIPVARRRGDQQDRCAVRNLRGGGGDQVATLDRTIEHDHANEVGGVGS